MSASQDPVVFTGARWSSAVRCIARAEYQALGTPGDEEALAFLRDPFARGVNAAENWVQQLERNAEAAGQVVYREVEVPWGPGGIWTGHADAVITPDEMVLEAYHSRGGEFREEKALQVAFYARKLGPTYRAMLVALDTSEMTVDGGFEMTTYPVEIEGLLDQLDFIESAVIGAYAEGRVDPEHKVGSSPDHPECKSCVFRETCWADYTPPPIEELPAMADVLDRLVMAQSNVAHMGAAYQVAKDLVADLYSQVRPYVPLGETRQAGGIEIRRTPVAPRKSFRLTDYLKAGHTLDETMQPFARESENVGERWSVKRVDA